MNLIALIFWAAVITGSILLVVSLRSSRADRGGSVHDLAEAAFLAGGPPRVVDTALAALHAEGLIGVGGPGLVVVLRPDLRARDHVGRAVLEQLAAAPSGALHELRLAVMRSPAVQEIGDGLAARGLMVAPDARRAGGRACLALGIGSLALLVTSIVLTVGADREPFEVPLFVKVVPVLFAGIVMALVCAAYNAGRATRGGRRAAAEYHRDHVYDADAGHQVALRGLRGVPDAELRTQLIAAARMPVARTRPATTPGTSRPHGTHHTHGTSGADAVLLPVLWCAGTPGSPGGCGGASGNTGGSGGGGGTDSGFGGGCSANACSGGSAGGSAGGSSCSSSGGGSSCSSSSGSSCSSSSGSSCSSSSGSSCSSSSG
ncbi:TIGR04222 domain-containing membrane protein [Streptomyces sp. NPDC096030]|uniref:TIGR04222 domain-containing membrane protein n=1 Tax=Streptomyces sp. NPDC096030 TaxID=3155423 RepID=UPI0033281AF2